MILVILMVRIWNHVLENLASFANSIFDGGSCITDINKKSKGLYPEALQILVTSRISDKVLFIETLWNPLSK